VVPDVGADGQLVEEPKMVHDYKGKYTKRDYCRITSFVFVVIGIPLWCILGSVLGAQQLAERSTGIVNAPAGLQDFIIFSEPVASNQMISQVGGTLIPLIEGIDDLVQTSVNFDELIDAALLFNSSRAESPRVQTFLDIGYEIANLTTDEAPPIVDGVLDIMVDLNTTLHNITVINGELIDYVTAIGVQNGKLSYELGNTSEVITDLRVLVVELVGDDSVVGAVTTISDDLGDLPATTDFDTAGTSVTSMGSSGLDGDSSGISGVVTDCNVVYATLAALPNYDTTAAALGTIDSNMAAMVSDYGSFDQLEWRLGNISSVVSNYPSFSDIGDLLLDLEDTALAIDIVELLDLLRDLLGLFDIVPRILNDVNAEVDKARGQISMGVNVTQTFTKQLYTINSTIIGLPDYIMDIANYTFGDEFNVDYLLKQMDNYTDIISETNETVTGEWLPRT